MIDLLAAFGKAIWHSQLLGVLVGIFAGGYWHLIQWRLESTKAEYRELISTLSRSARRMMDNSPSLALTIVMYSGDQLKIAHDADVEARLVIEDRILIAKRMEADEILNRWGLMAALDNGQQFWAQWRQLHDSLVTAARQDLSFWRHFFALFH